MNVGDWLVSRRWPNERSTETDAEIWSRRHDAAERAESLDHSEDQWRDGGEESNSSWAERFAPRSSRVGVWDEDEFGQTALPLCRRVSLELIGNSCRQNASSSS